MHFFVVCKKKVIFAPQYKIIKQKNMASILERVRGIIVDKLGVEAKEVTPEASFANDLGADSLDTVELIMELEKEFNITIPDQEAQKISTVGDVIKYLEARVNG